jgi:hypothetical protein
VINAIKFSIEEIEASDQYFDHTATKFGVVKCIIMTFLYLPTWEALTAIGTVAMAVTTVVVIFQGRRLRKDDERRHQDEFRPIVILTPYDGVDPQFRRDSLLAIFDQSSSDFGTVAINCALRNIGSGPALNVAIKFRFMDMNGYTTPPWEISPLRAGEQRGHGNSLCVKIQYLPGFNKSDFTQIVGKAWQIILLYEDVFGNSFHSIHLKNPLQLDRAVIDHDTSETVAPQQPWVTVRKGKFN